MRKSFEDSSGEKLLTQLIVRFSNMSQTSIPSTKSWKIISAEATLNTSMIWSPDIEAATLRRLTKMFDRYQGVLGCNGIQLSNTSSLYARYTKSVLCNGIVMDSKGPCDLGDDTATLCADTCVRFSNFISLGLLLTIPAGPFGDKQARNRDQSRTLRIPQGRFHG